MHQLFHFERFILVH